MTAAKQTRGTVANHYVTALYHAAKKQGLDAEAMLAEHGFSLSDLEKPEHRLDTDKLAAFQRAAWYALSDESMGHLQTTLPIGTYYLMGRLAVAQPTLHDALLCGIQFYNIVTRIQISIFCHVLRRRIIKTALT